jgi:hypothetical protein
MTKTLCALSWKNPQLLACFLMASLSLLRGDLYTDILTFLTQILMGALFIFYFWLGMRFFGHLLCCVEGRVGFTCSLEITVCYTKLMQSIALLQIIVIFFVIDYNKALVE